MAVGFVCGLSTSEGIVDSQLGTTGKDRFLCAAKISFNIPGCGEAGGSTGPDERAERLRASVCGAPS